jgi:hypothetical protein
MSINNSYICKFLRFSHQCGCGIYSLWPLKMRPLHCLYMLGIKYPVTQRHSPEQIPQLTYLLVHRLTTPSLFYLTTIGCQFLYPINVVHSATGMAEYWHKVTSNSCNINRGQCIPRQQKQCHRQSLPHLHPSHFSPFRLKYLVILFNSSDKHWQS